MIIVFLLLLALIIPILRVEPLQDSVVLPKLAATAAFAGAALVLTAVQLVRGRVQIPRWPVAVWLSIAVFVVVNVAAFADALDWRWSLIGEYQRYQGLATTLLYVLLFAVTAFAVRSTRDLRWLLLAVFAAGVGTSIYALMQKADLDPFDEHFGSTLGRPSATVGQANAFAAYLVAVLSSTAFLVLTARKRWQQALLAAGAVLMLFALLFTLSRAGFVAAFVVFVIAAVATAVWYRFYRLGERPQPRQLALTAAAGAGIALVVVVLGAALFVRVGPGQTAAGRFDDASAQDESVAGRISLWRMAARMTIDGPLLGHGQDAFTVLFPEYRDRPDYPGINTKSVQPESAHNFFLDLASGTGVLGLLAFLAFVGCLLWYAVQRTLLSDDIELRLALLALGGSVTGYLVAVFFGFSEAMTTWLLWLLLGAIAGLLAEETPGVPERLLSRLPAAGVLAVCGVVALGWAATLVAADLAAGQTDRALARRDYPAAVRLIDRAVSLNPLQKSYLEQKAQVYRLAAPPSEGRAEGLQKSIDISQTVLDRFEPSAIDLIDRGLTEFELAQLQGTPVEDTFPLFEEGVDLDPYNILIKSFVADFYENQGFDDLALEHRLEILGWNDQ